MYEKYKKHQRRTHSHSKLVHYICIFRCLKQLINKLPSYFCVSLAVHSTKSSIFIWKTILWNRQLVHVYTTQNCEFQSVSKHLLLKSNGLKFILCVYVAMSWVHCNEHGLSSTLFYACFITWFSLIVHVVPSSLREKEKCKIV